MNIQTALLPHKHVRFCDSLLGLAGFIRGLLTEPRTVDELWALIDRENSGWLARPSFTHVVLAIHILFALKEVELTRSNRLRRISP
jgi:hypothetical protein